MATKHRFSLGVPARQQTPQGQPYPPRWEDVADLRVLRTRELHWQRLIGWRAELSRGGWRLLRVDASDGELVAVFGRTKGELLQRPEATPDGNTRSIDATG
jgi:hypothetical protein